MYKKYCIWLLPMAVAMIVSCGKKHHEEWIDLFNGKDLTGWKSNESDESFKVEDGLLVASGPRSHLFYVGEGNASFRNFELSADIMTTYTANSGIYFHTEWQDSGWPSVGLEAQINNSHKGAGDYKEVKKGGSLYALRNLYKAPSQDSTWYNMNIKVEGKRIQIRINGQLMVDYVEPLKPLRFREGRQDRLSSGTFALQCHDPESKVYFKNIRLKILDDNLETPNVPETDAYGDLLRLQSEHFPMIDMDVAANENFQMDSALHFFRHTGINVGLVTDDIDNLSRFYETHKGYPVFLGVKLNDLSGENVVDPALREKFDYVLGEFRKDSTEDIKDREAFMEKYIDELVAALNAGRLDVLSNATSLPPVIADQYDQLWTVERMGKVADALKTNGVAIGIDAQSMMPGLPFIKLAKEKGCMFSLENASKNGEVNLSYYLKVIEEAKLNYKDVYIPDKML